MVHTTVASRGNGMSTRTHADVESISCVQQWARVPAHDQNTPHFRTDPVSTCCSTLTRDEKKTMPSILVAPEWLSFPSPPVHPSPSCPEAVAPCCHLNDVLCKLRTDDRDPASVDDGAAVVTRIVFRFTAAAAALAAAAAPLLHRRSTIVLGGRIAWRHAERYMFYAPPPLVPALLCVPQVSDVSDRALMRRDYT